MPIEVHPAHFRFPNFLQVREWEADTIDVGHFSPDQAAAYWDEMKPLWIAHVAQRHKAILDRCLQNKPSVLK